MSMVFRGFRQPPVAVAVAIAGLEFCALPALRFSHCQRRFHGVVCDTVNRQRPQGLFSKLIVWDFFLGLGGALRPLYEEEDEELLQTHEVNGFQA